MGAAATETLAPAGPYGVEDSGCGYLRLVGPEPESDGLPQYLGTVCGTDAQAWAVGRLLAVRPLRLRPVLRRDVALQRLRRGLAGTA